MTLADSINQGDTDISNAEIIDDTPAPERRMHMQAYNLWACLLEEGSFPSADDILAHELCDFANNAVRASVDTDGNGSITFVGNALPELPNALPLATTDVPGRSLLSRVTNHILEPVANKSPVGFEADFTDEQDQELSYRAIALPCSSDGVHIDTVLGVISFINHSDPAAIETAEPNSGEANKQERAENTQTREQEGQKASSLTEDEKRTIIMSYKKKLEECMEIDGALAVALVDMGSGMSLATESSAAGKKLDLEVAAGGNTNVLRAKYDTMKNLGLKEEIEDMLITLESQIHMLRPATSESGKGLFIYLALDKNKANLAMARHKLRVIEKDLTV